MKEEVNEAQTDRNEVLKSYTHLYTPRQTPQTKEYQPRIIRSPTDNHIRSQENRGRNEKQGLGRR